MKSSLAVGQFRTQTDVEGRTRLDRLRLLDIEQMAMTLAFLPATGLRPSAASRIAPSRTARGCGESVGIFLGHGTEWHHFRVASAAASPGDGPTEAYDADHAPAIGWRYAVASR